VSLAGTTGVTISSSTGHDGTTDYTKTVTADTSVNLQAPEYVDAGAERKRFSNWTGAATSLNLAINLTMDTDKSVTAGYVADPVTYTLSVSSAGAAAVPITSSTGYGGTTDYTKTVTAETEVTLTAQAAWGGMVFTGWSGSVTVPNQSITLTMDTVKNVTANYQLGSTTYTLSVYSRGARGVPIITSVGLDGTTNYTKTVTADTEVTLTAPPASGGRTFAGWSGAVSSSSQTIDLTMDAVKSVTANYTRSACDASTVFVDAVVPRLLRGDPGGWSFGYVTVRIQDNCGNPVSDAVVTGTFTGRYKETLAAATNAHGIAIFTTSNQVKNPTFTFCVDDIAHAALSYSPGDNIETCDSY
jgi:hypothetical protein